MILYMTITIHSLYTWDTVDYTEFIKRSFIKVSFKDHSQRSSSSRYVLWTSFGRIDKCQPPKKLDLVTSLGLKTFYNTSISIFNRNPKSISKSSSNKSKKARVWTEGRVTIKDRDWPLNFKVECVFLMVISSEFR